MNFIVFVFFWWWECVNSPRLELFYFVLLKPKKIKQWCGVFLLISPSSNDFLIYILWLSFVASSQCGPNDPASQGAAAFLCGKKRFIIATCLPASVLALWSEVRPNYFTYLMYCHRLDGNRHSAHSHYFAPMPPNSRPKWCCRRDPLLCPGLAIMPF